MQTGGIKKLSVLVNAGLPNAFTKIIVRGVTRPNYYDPQNFLKNLFKTALAAANPEVCLPAHLPPPGKGRNIVIGAGKAAASMAAALEATWGDAAYEGVVVTRYGHTCPTRRIRVLQAGHPVPDAQSEAAGQEILAAVQALTAQDQVIMLLSGGASALLESPIEGVTLDDLILVNHALLDSGAPITTLNRIRTALSALKGGKLAAACAPAKVTTLAISDVPGDNPAVIGSGPTWHKGADYRLIATPSMALHEAAAQADLPVEILGDDLEGEAAALGRAHAALAKATKGPKLLLSGGETTVTIGPSPAGRGGRNSEYLLSLALALDNAPNIYALAADTDGIDGTEDAAGAIITPETLPRARAKGLDAAASLTRHDSYSFFAALDDLLITGPTLTNVNDFRAILIL